jgi:hypothetical protein
MVEFLLVGNEDQQFTEFISSDQFRIAFSTGKGFRTHSIPYSINSEDIKLVECIYC